MPMPIADIGWMRRFFLANGSLRRFMMLARLLERWLQGAMRENPARGAARGCRLAGWSFERVARLRRSCLRLHSRFGWAFPASFETRRAYSARMSIFSDTYRGWIFASNLHCAPIEHKVDRSGHSTLGCASLLDAKLEHLAGILACDPFAGAPRYGVEVG